MRVLVTGGAGFIGTHLVRSLVDEGHEVRVLDALVAQVHGRSPEPPALPGATFVRADVRDRDALNAALDGVEAVFHQAAEVGVGQSMYAIERYVGANTLATAILLEALVERRHGIRRLVVASSMSIYGEGQYACGRCGPVAPPLRPDAQLEAREWELRCAGCGATLRPIPTPETKPLDPVSVYAVTKQDQEQLCLAVGRAYGIPTVALRYFNVYGPGQALSNPYTGVAAIISGRLLSGQPPVIFEDGRQSRDFVHVRDIVRANLLALHAGAAVDRAINVGTGRATTILEMARMITAGLGADVAPLVAGRFRAGDIRHCVADVSRARSVLGFEPSVSLETGLPDLLDWVRRQHAENAVEQATAELETRGLIR